MAAADDHTRDELPRTVSQRLSLSASSRNPSFLKPLRDDEDELKSAAIKSLSNYENSKKEKLKQVHGNGRTENTNVDRAEKKQIIEGVLKVIEEDHESFLLLIRERIDR